MTITPININDVVTALVNQIQSFPAVQSADIEAIERSEPQNEDPNRCPWVCVYREGASFPVRTMGVGTGFRRQEIHLGVAMQEADATSGAQCEERLEALVQAVVGAILSDTTLGGTIYTVADQFELVYIDYRQEQDQFLQTAYLRFTAIGQVSAGG